MQATAQQIETLEQLVEIDMGLLALKRKLDALPQREQIQTLREKRALLSQKKRSLMPLHEKAAFEVNRLTDEVKLLTARIEGLQQKVDDAQGDFRSVSSLTKELDGAAKRKEAVEVSLKEAVAKLSEADSLLKRVNAGSEDMRSQEASLLGQINEQAAGIKAEADEAAAKRTALMAVLDADQRKEYVRACKECGGVAVAHLNGSSCSACRNSLDQNRLLQIRHEAPLSVCPHCKRLLVVE